MSPRLAHGSLLRRVPSASTSRCGKGCVQSPLPGAGKSVSSLRSALQKEAQMVWRSPSNAKTSFPVPALLVLPSYRTMRSRAWPAACCGSRWRSCSWGSPLHVVRPGRPPSQNARRLPARCPSESSGTCETGIVTSSAPARTVSSNHPCWGRVNCTWSLSCTVPPPGPRLLRTLLLVPGGGSRDSRRGSRVHGGRTAPRGARR